MEKIPRDVFFDIFSRLPLKSVIQASCVSKSWFNIIKDPEFVKLHVSKSEPEPRLLILTHRLVGEKNVISLSHMEHKGFQLSANVTAIDHMVSSLSWDLVGTCEGLLCFTSSAKEEILICNPITRENVIIPTPSVAPSSELLETMFAFGFDPIEKKYKVLRLFYPKVAVRTGLGIQITTHVYTLGNSDSWREVRGFVSPPYGKPVCANGAVYWMAHPLFYSPFNNIVSFDLAKEQFNLLCHGLFGPKFSLLELGGHLSVVLLSSDFIQISVLKDPVQNCWEMKYIIPLRKRWARNCKSPSLICAHEHNGVLLVWLTDCLLSYERRVFRTSDLKIAGLPIWTDWEICSGYRGSLVPLGNFHIPGEERKNVVCSVSNVGLHSLVAKAGGFSEWKSDGRCDKIVTCFLNNGMLL